MSTWVVIRATDGSKRLVKPGEPYTLASGELIAGIEHVPEEKPEDAIDKLARHFGIDVADFIEKAARMLRIPPCPTCQVRKQILYTMNELGWRRTLIMLWHTLRGANPSEKDLSEMDHGD